MGEIKREKEPLRFTFTLNCVMLGEFKEKKQKQKQQQENWKHNKERESKTSCYKNKQGI